jgi:hypothetical protein
LALGLLTTTAITQLVSTFVTLVLIWAAIVVFKKQARSIPDAKGFEQVGTKNPKSDFIKTKRFADI